MNARITVQKWTIRGKVRWAVHRMELGKRTRTFFSSKKAADAEAALLRSQRAETGDVWITLSAFERQHLLQVHHEAKKLGVDLAELLSAWKRGPRSSVASSPCLEDVIAELSSAKVATGRSHRYADSLTLLLHQFAKGRERLPIADVHLTDVEGFLDSKGLHSRQTLRARLSTLFRFAVRRGYRADNPCDRLESIKVVKTAPAILTIEQTRKCLAALDEKPRALAWFALTTFAGLRPEEAEKTSWDQINFEEGWIRVEAQTTKVRQRRVVYPTAMAMAWLNRAKTQGAELPIGKTSRRRAIRVLRTALGLSIWPKDFTRHSAASYWLAETGNAATVAAALGHSENVLRKNYMALVTKAQAKEFWGLAPGSLQ